MTITRGSKQVASKHRLSTRVHRASKQVQHKKANEIEFYLHS